MQNVSLQHQHRRNLISLRNKISMRLSASHSICDKHPTTLIAREVGHCRKLQRGSARQRCGQALSKQCTVDAGADSPALNLKCCSFSVVYIHFIPHTTISMSSPAVSPLSPRAYLVCPPPALPTISHCGTVADSESAVLIIQHDASVPPGYLAYFFAVQRTPFYVFTIDAAGAVLPPPEQSWLAIITLGGPQGAYEESCYAWLALEKQFLRAHIARQTPILAICLGSQILASAIGGQAFPAPKDKFEVGYVPIRLTQEGTQDTLLAKVFNKAKKLPSGVLTSPELEESAAAAGAHNSNNSAAAVCWCSELSTESSCGFFSDHGDTFTLPAGVSALAQSPTFTQAYRTGSALGIQFHPEAGVHEVSSWTASGSPEPYKRVGTSVDEVVAEVARRQEEARAHAWVFFSEWWQSIGQQLLPQSEEA
jgi:GMP synthase (glutamine-hydrolysing)